LGAISGLKFQITDRSPFVKRLIPIACAFVAVSAATVPVPEIPVRTLAPSHAISRDTFGTILSLRELPDGKVLVNDGTGRRVLLLDSTLANAVIVLDSVSGSSNAYGPRPAPFIPYQGDSVLFADVRAQVLLMIDPAGRVARTIAPPNPRDLIAMTTGNAAADSKGRLIYRVTMRVVSTGPGGGTMIQSNPDSALIVRADFVSRAVDTIARLRSSTGRRSELITAPNGDRVLRTTVNPLPQLDDWAVLSSGDLAVVRGSDYHVDWIRPDGSAGSSPKMAFDWRRLTDEDKRRLVDSAKAAYESQQAALPPAGAPGSAVGAGGGGGRGGGGSISVSRAGGGAMPVTRVMLKTETEFAAPSDIVDYYPPMRTGAVHADRDGNLWILTATSAQSKEGELVYDVVNSSGELFQRVRFPVGRSLAGFGPKGTVYLMHGSLGKGFVLERTAIASAS
jgi:hypothetical protein